MTPERWQQIKAVFDDARELPPDERGSRLAELLARDAEMHHHVVSLLEADSLASGFLETPPLAEIDRAVDLHTALPSHIGAYRIVREIGRGGMGVVLLGARDDNAYQKEVAIKVMRAGADPELLRRFIEERRILAQLVHPNIATLLDGGTTDKGQPFLVMELVDGATITAHCDAAGLSIEERLRLFLLVCDAVQHAHQRLVVHRDIKPANILVTHAGVPKLLDFGIAKLLADGPGATVTMAQMLTPEYASPEQIRGGEITVATDVYALGVVLYCLLTGARPYAPKTDQPHDLARAIAEDDPARPSTKRPLAADLDTIILKALQKDLDRRYSSVEAFAADIRRYLEGLPVLAHADSLAYRAAKFAGRHRAAVAGAAALVVAIVAGVLATAWQWRAAERERAIAERRFNDVRSLARSVVFDIHDAIADLPGATTARSLIVQKGLEYLDAAGREASGDRDLQLEVAAAYERISEIQASSGKANLGEEKSAMVSAEKAFEMRRSVIRDHPDYLPAMRAYALSLRQLTYLKPSNEAVTLVAEAVKLRERIAAITADPEDTYRVGQEYHIHGQQLATVGRFEESLTAYERARAVYEGRLKTEPGRAAALGHLSLLLKNSGAVHHYQGRYDQALASYRRALEIDEARLAQEPDSAQARLNVTFALGSVAGALGDSGHTREAIEYHRRALAIRERQSALDKADASARALVLRSYQSIGRLQLRDDPAAAIATFQQALRIIDATAVRTRPIDVQAAWIHGGIGDAHRAAARSAGSAPLTAARNRQALASYERSRATFETLRASAPLAPPDERAFDEVVKTIATLRPAQR